jgi:hypothetical protein
MGNRFDGERDTELLQLFQVIANEVHGANAINTIAP